MFSISWKQIVMFVGLLLVAGAIGVGLYYFFFRPETPVVTVPPVTETIGELPISGPGEIPTTPPTTPVIPTGEVPITTEPTPTVTTTIDRVAAGGITKVNDLSFNYNTAVALDSTGQGLLAYDQQSGEFSKLDDTGRRTPLTSKKFPGATDVAWAPQSEKAIVEFPDGSNIMYDFSTDKQVTLPANWTAFSFNKTENQIAFKDMDTSMDKRFVSVASPDGSNQKFVEFMGNAESKVNVQFSPNNQYVATVNHGSTSGSSKIYFVGQNNENFKSLEVNGYNVEYTYTPDSNRMVYSAQSTYSNNKPELFVVDVNGDATGQNHEDLGLQTWSDKCTFEGTQTMYCAVPRQLPDGAGWFRELANGVPDDIYKVNLQTGEKSFVAQPQYDTTIQTMEVSADGSTLFFTNQITKAVQSIRIQ